MPYQNSLMNEPRNRAIRLARNSAMPMPYGIEIVKSCLACPTGFVTGLSAEARNALDAIFSTSVLPKGANLYVEGQASRGVFLICTGRVKLSVTSAGGKVLVLRVAEAGELVGVHATLSGRRYEATAETMEPTQTNLIRRDEFLKFLRDHEDAFPKVAEQMTTLYFKTVDEFRSLGLSHSVKQRIARFTLDWSAQHSDGHDRLQIGLSQEEIGKLIGTSRETVTRALTHLKAKQFISRKGARLDILNRAALEKLGSM